MQTLYEALHEAYNVALHVIINSRIGSIWSALLGTFLYATVCNKIMVFAVSNIGILIT